MNLIPDDCNSLLLTWIHFGYTLKYPSARWISLSLSPSFRPMAGQTGGHFEREELVCAFVQLFILYHEESLMIILFFCFFLSARERETRDMSECHVTNIWLGTLSFGDARRSSSFLFFFFFSFFSFYLLLLYTYTFCEFLVFPLHFFFFLFFFFLFFISLHTYKSLWRRVDSSSRLSVFSSSIHQRRRRKRGTHESFTTLGFSYICSTWHTPCIGRDDAVQLFPVIRYHHHHIFFLCIFIIRLCCCCHRRRLTYLVTARLTTSPPPSSFFFFWWILFASWYEIPLMAHWNLYKITEFVLSFSLVYLDWISLDSPLFLFYFIYFFCFCAIWSSSLHIQALVRECLCASYYHHLRQRRDAPSPYFHIFFFIFHFYLRWVSLSLSLLFALRGLVSFPTRKVQSDKVEKEKKK